VVLLLQWHRQGYLIAQIFFGLYLLPLAYLVHGSSYFPKAVGVVLMLGGGGYLADVAATYLSAGFESSVGLLYLGCSAVSLSWCSWCRSS
jgi:hypothetical protein